MKKAIIATFVFLAMQAIVPAIGTFILGAFASGSPEETGQVSAAILAPTVIGIELLFAYLLTVGALYAWQMLTPAFPSWVFMSAPGQDMLLSGTRQRRFIRELPVLNTLCSD